MCLVLALSGIRAYAAQQQAPSLRGVVRDDAGTALAGVTVTLTDAQQQPRTVTTDSIGAYAFENLAPGLYQLTVQLEGFSPLSRQVNVEASRTSVVNLRMRMAFDQRVEVVGSLAEFRRVTGMGAVGLTLGPEQLGVLPNDPDMMLQVLRELSATTGRADQVIVQVDGQPVASRLPPKAAIQSIRISTNAFAAEFPEPSSGLVEIITKPANTTFRGEWQGTLNDTALNSKNYFEDERRSAPTQAYTGYFGGPIVPGRWSFLGYGGHWKRDDQLVVNAIVPDPQTGAAERFVQSVGTPAQIDASSLRTDFITTPNHLFSLEFAHTAEKHRNLGLESGLDLPERAIDRNVKDEAARLSAISSFGTQVTSELRLRGRRRELQEAAIATTPAVIVLDSFSAGGNQAALRQNRTTQEVSLTQTVSFADEWQTIRGGVQLDFLRLTEQRQTNHSGTYVFGSVVGPDGSVVATSLDRYIRTVNGEPGYGPSSFSIARGEPTIAFDDWQASLFFQDDIQYVGNLTGSFGLRYTLQKYANNFWFDLAPRAGLAWTPGGTNSHVARVVLGLFHSRIPADITLDTLRYDGVAVEEYFVDRPGFFPDIPPDFDATRARPTVRLKDDVRSPLTAAGAASYEWQVTKTFFASVGYNYAFGSRLLRSRNINVRDPATGLLPYPDQGPMLQFESTGRSKSHELRVTARRALARVSVFGTYIRRTAFSDTDGPYTIAGDSRTLRNEYGRAGDDERHRMVIGSWVSLPWELSLSTLLTTGTGRPFDITTGLDNDGDLLFYDRPAPGLAGDPGIISTAFGDFDVRPSAGGPLIARNSGQGPSQLVFNIGLAKTIRFGSSAGSGPYAIFGVSAENVTNRVNFVDFNGVVTSPLFGAANRALNPRRIELSARFGF
jgi:Carboxypeptidase regulatory-like domain